MQVRLLRLKSTKESLWRRTRRGIYTLAARRKTSWFSRTIWSSPFCGWRLSMSSLSRLTDGFITCAETLPKVFSQTLWASMTCESRIDQKPEKKASPCYLRVIVCYTARTLSTLWLPNDENWEQSPKPHTVKKPRAVRKYFCLVFWRIWFTVEPHQLLDPNLQTKRNIPNFNDFLRKIGQQLGGHPDFTWHRLCSLFTFLRVLAHQNQGTGNSNFKTIGVSEGHALRFSGHLLHLRIRKVSSAPGAFTLQDIRATLYILLGMLLAVGKEVSVKSLLVDAAANDDDSFQNADENCAEEDDHQGSIVPVTSPGHHAQIAANEWKFSAPSNQCSNSVIMAWKVE